MNIDLISEIKSDVKVEFIQESELKEHKRYKILKKAGFEAKQETLCFLHEKKILACGIEDATPDSIRSSCSNAIKSLKSSNYKSASFDVNAENIQAIIEGVILGGYEFNDYKSKPEKSKLKNIYLTCKNISKLQKQFEEAIIIAEATCYTRDIVNTTPEDLNPPSFADLAKKLAKENSLECVILGEKELRKEKMESMLAVGRASRHDSKLIHLTYKPKNPKKVISLIGKGLTYDSGGLSLKPAASMVTMKMDKAGGCAVLGMIKAASELKLDIEIHAFVGAVENMIGGDAYKPDDVLVTRSGKTVEVRNTDAEGRLVLCDVLDYAQEKVNADYMFDFATLTGACMVALGQYTTGVMGHSNKLKDDFDKAANSSGELVGSLPFNKHLKKLLKSGIADISNVSSKPFGGAITAGLFLDNFIKEENKEKWLHFDIAGSAYTETPWDCNVYGGTGAGVRFMSQFLRNI
ncbi:leucyl aminopeptidase [Sulfurimonas aquatica]|uniref:Probable cytosol aminopeptidase n=1 Tax=Sulfurimonas aquatica TaxID=2672570 RepID=A0A975GCW6_9BACT|nr:leucyl aminopeptidase [Sulfurimonas aquatica]QSZ41709.1 leucyl aminopeptidase [Sulfurimonas aquatica]